MTRHRVDISTRQQDILNLINEHGAQYIEGLAARYGLTTQTLRRDINQLCDLGLARRFHGGVDLPVDGRNLSARARTALNRGAKRAIAQRVAAEIPDGATVLLGIGTTVQFVAEALRDHRELTVITNNLDVALVLCEAKHLEVHVTGGILRHHDRDVVGGDTTAFFEKFHASVAVVGAGGLTLRDGVMDYSHREAQVSNALIANAQKTFLAADASKWNRGATVKVAPLTRFAKVFTDILPDDPAIARRLADMGTRLVLCGAGLDGA